MLLPKKLIPFIYGTTFGYFSKVVTFYIRLNRLGDKTSSVFKLIIQFSSFYFLQCERAEIGGERRLAHFLNSFSYWSRKRIYLKTKKQKIVKDN